MQPWRVDAISSDTTKELLRARALVEVVSYLMGDVVSDVSHNQHSKGSSVSEGQTGAGHGDKATECRRRGQIRHSWHNNTSIAAATHYAEVCALLLSRS
jgi:hypothetical protein